MGFIVMLIECKIFALCFLALDVSVRSKLLDDVCPILYAVYPKPVDLKQ